MRPTATTDSPAEELCLLEARDMAERLTSIGVPATNRRDKPVGKLRITPNDFMALCRPGVYIFWKADRALYVGKGRRVMNRMSSPNHGAVGRAMLECDAIEILFFSDEIVASNQESALINYLQPTLNRRGLGSVLGDALDE